MCLEGRYLVRLRATHAGTKSLLAAVQDVRGGREEVLEAALTLTRQLRRQLGESLTVAQAASPPLEPVTSRSVEAVRHFTLGKQLYDVERPKEALPHFMSAIESDPAFAMGHNYVALTYSYLGEYQRQGQFLETAASLASDPAPPVSQAEREKIPPIATWHSDPLLTRRARDGGTPPTLRPADGRADCQPRPRRRSSPRQFRSRSPRARRHGSRIRIRGRLVDTARHGERGRQVDAAMDS